MIREELPFVGFRCRYTNEPYALHNVTNCIIHNYHNASYTITHLVDSIYFLLSAPVSAAVQEVTLGTKPEVILRKGTTAHLPCRVDRKIATLNWSKSPSPSSSKEVLIIFTFYKDVWTKEGPGYSDGSYNITSNFSLIINDVRIEDNAHFFCEILDIDTGRNFINQTNVTVFGKSSKFIQLKSLFLEPDKSTFGISEKNMFLCQNLYTCLWGKILIKNVFAWVIWI